MIMVDANVILRFLLNDHPRLASKAEKVIKYYGIILSKEVLAEVVYVLTGVYKISRKETAEKLVLFVRSSKVFISDKNKVIDGLKIFGSSNLDFVDSLLCAYSDVNTIATFDKKLRKCVENKKGRLLEL